MNYLYKLLDETTKKELLENNRISLSRPFFEFKSEGKGVSIFRDIEKIFDSANNPNTITPTKAVLIKIKKWIDDYYYSLPENIRKEYSYNYDLDDDLLIAMTVYCQSYCGYFTDDDLENKNIREQYLLQNARLSFNKCAYVKIPIESNMLDQLYWVSNSNDYTFEYNNEQLDDSSAEGIQAALHIHKVEYAQTEDLKKPFKAFNGKDCRRISSLFKYLNNEYGQQNEQRLILRIPSYKPREHVVAFSNLYRSFEYTSVEEHVFYLLASIYRQAKNYPRFVYLKIKNFEYKNI